MKRTSIVGLFISSLFCLHSRLGSSQDHNATTDLRACKQDNPDDYFPTPQSSTIRNVGVAFLISVAILAILCNSLIIHVVRVNKHMHTTTNYLLVNMAVGDTFAAILSSSITLYNVYNGNSWTGDLVFGEYFYCRMICPLYYLSMLCSIYSLVVITFDRFLVVTRPLKHKHRSFWSKYTIPCIWITSAAVASHYALRKLNFCSHQAKFYCIPQASTLQAILMLCLGFVLPHLIIFTLYSKIAYTLCTRKVPGEQAQNVGDQTSTEKVAKKVTMMIVCIFVAFDVAYVPIYIGFLFPFLFKGKSTDSFIEVGAYKILLITNGISNALIYAVFNASFNHAFKKALTFNRYKASSSERLTSKSRSSHEKSSITGTS